MGTIKYPMVRSEYDQFWRKHCSFFDLSIEQFTTIQETFLLQQLEQITGSPLSEKLIGRRMPMNVTEFRHSVPLTTYEDYLPEFDRFNNDFLPAKPYVWAQTSGASGTFKHIPYTLEFYNKILHNLMSALITACSRERGQSSLTEGDRVLFNVAPSPYLSGILASGASQMFNLRPVMPPDVHDNLDFKEKISKGFEVSLRTGVDILVAMTSVLVKIGYDFNDISRSKKSRHISHPVELYRVARAFLRSRLENRNLLPKDLWPLKTIIGWGTDTHIYREAVHKFWGMYPYELHACTEAGIVALQSWNKKDLTLIPDSNFYEFIPEAEWLKCRDDVFYKPHTVLPSEVRPGERYEMVITGFYGMPFIRYRSGHLIKITALEDKEAGIGLPQMAFETRADDLIDIAGFTRISEKTVSQAIANVGVCYEDWSIRKEISRGKPTLHLYIEPNGIPLPENFGAVLHRELKNLDPGYRDLDQMMNIRTLEVTLLRRGTFSDYYAAKRENGAELHCRKPPRMDAPDDIIRELVRLNSQQQELVLRS